MAQIKNYSDLIDLIKKTCMSFGVSENQENLSLVQRIKLSKSRKPKCLILDDIEPFFANDLTAMKKLMKFLFKEKQIKKNDEINLDKDFENILNIDKDRIKLKRPLVFVCNDLYGRGLKELRFNAINFQIMKDEDIVVDKVTDICNKEVFSLFN